MTPRRAFSAIRTWIAGASARRHLTNPILITILAASLIGVTSGEVLASTGSGDRMVVGNTGGTLSAVIQVKGTVVVIGGGNARTDLADLVGRSTVPWRRHVNLLVVPGWDDQQAIGALGLIERGDVKQIVVLGTPSDSAIARALQQAAAERAIPLTVVTGQNSVSIASDISLDLLAAQPTSDVTPEYAVVTLHYYDSSITFVDASKDGVKSMSGDSVEIGRTHLLVEMRTFPSLQLSANVMLQPRAETNATLSDSTSSYVGEIMGGQRITVRLSKRELRLPIDHLTANLATYAATSAVP